MPTVLRALLIALALSLIPIGIGLLVTGGDPAPQRAPAQVEAVPLTDFDTTQVAITRTGFCDRLPATAVAAALGHDATHHDAYANGDKRDVGPGKADIVHEYGCSFSAAGARARAWVFAPPVTTDRARSLARAATGAGCERRPDAPAYGEPSVAVLCGGKRRTASFRGLFGDAWLTCSLQVGAPPAKLSDAELLDRTGRWCVAVAQAAAA